MLIMITIERAVFLLIISVIVSAKPQKTVTSKDIIQFSQCVIDIPPLPFRCIGIYTSFSLPASYGQVRVTDCWGCATPLILAFTVNL